MPRTLPLLAAAFALVATTASAAETLRIGFLTTLSGPGAVIGADIRDGFLLALEQAGGKLGGLDTQVFEADDQQKPDVAVGLANRMVERDRVQFVTGTIWSNLALAMMPTLASAQVFFISPNAGTAQLAGAQCSPFFFNVSWTVDVVGEMAGLAAMQQGVKRAYVMAPNYPAGKDVVAGFRRSYKGELAGEVFTQLGQLDYAAEIAQVKAARPDAVFIFLPGGMGINFLKQYQQAGLVGEIPLIGPGFSFDQDTFGAVGDAVLGVKNTLQWSQDLDVPANREFMAAFTAKYGRQPSYYAAQAYDAARLIDGAVKAVGGDLSDKDRLRKALEAAPFESTRGAFRFNTNHYPIQTYYLREVVKGPDGALTNRIIGTVATDVADLHAASCPTK
ncbi:MAG TPA: ABC transporter substrate-binding protein [Azospirillum sp.]|nr:ABC transporter substrate-binding protein [Azospirillum sp.]